MSHFTVLVIGDDVEGQLAPYHEFECTGLNDQYVQEIDRTEEVLKRVSDGETLNDSLSYFGWEDKTVYDESELDREGYHKYGYAILNSDSSLKKAVDRTNPDAKWDWYSVGGRWTGFFKIKEGRECVVGHKAWCSEEAEAGHADQARLEDIDLDGMRDEAARKAAEDYDAAQKVYEGLPECEDWDVVRLRMDDIEKAREFWHSQPKVKARAKAGKDDDYRSNWVFNDPCAYQVPREQFIQSARDKAISTFAVVKDGKWHEKGKMGWWASVSGEKDPETWAAVFSHLLDGLPGDTMLTLVDCHI